MRGLAAIPIGVEKLVLGVVRANAKRYSPEGPDLWRGEGNALPGTCGDPLSDARARGWRVRHTQGLFNERHGVFNHCGAK